MFADFEDDDDDGDNRFGLGTNYGGSEQETDAIDSDIETMLYAQVYHVSVEDDASNVLTAQAKIELNREEPTMPYLSLSKEATTKRSVIFENQKISNSHAKLESIAHDDDDDADDSIYVSKNSFSDNNKKSVENSSLKSATAAVRKRRKLKSGVSTSKKAKELIIECLKMSDQERVINIKNSFRPKVTTKSSSRASSTSSSSSSSDDVDVYHCRDPVDTSFMYTHISEGKIASRKDGMALLKSISNAKSTEMLKKLTRKSDKIAKKSSKVRRKKKKNKKTMLEPEVRCETPTREPMEERVLLESCRKAMSRFYTTLDGGESYSSKHQVPKKMLTKRARSADWVILGSDRRRSKSTRGRFFMKCTICCENGHESVSCPMRRRAPKCRLCGEGHLLESCINRMCSICWQPWHRINECPAADSDYPLDCQICQRQGHVAEQCSDHWRKFHSRIDPDDEECAANDGRHNLRPFKESACYNCGQKGHYGYECKYSRMNRGLIPFLPFVTDYYCGRDYEGSRARFGAKSACGRIRNGRNLEERKRKDRRRDERKSREADVFRNKYKTERRRDFEEQFDNDEPDRKRSKNNKYSKDRAKDGKTKQKIKANKLNKRGSNSGQEKYRRSYF